MKILLDYWWVRRHIWVTRSRGDLISIDCLTEVLYDSIHGDLGPRYEHYLQMRCKHEVGGGKMQEMFRSQDSVHGGEIGDSHSALSRLPRRSWPRNRRSLIQAHVAKSTFRGDGNRS